MKAALLTTGSISSTWLAEEMRKYFDEVDEINLKKVDVCVSGKEQGVFYEGKKLKDYDCVYGKGGFKQSSLLRSIITLMNKSYSPIISNLYTIAHDKLLTHIELQKAGIPQPATYLASNAELAKKILKKITYPIVLKVPAGTHGKGVMIADSYESASSMLDALALLKQQFILQEFISTGGTDIRAIVVGDRVVAAMERKANKGEARANIHAGGTGYKIDLDNKTRKLAIDTAKTLGAEVCGIDILQSAKGPLVIEINISPGLQGITEATKVNVAGRIAKFLYERTKEKQNVQSQKVVKQTLSSKQQIITKLDFRGERILLPKLVSLAAKIGNEKDVVITAKKGTIIIEEEKV